MLNEEMKELIPFGDITGQSSAQLKRPLWLQERFRRHPSFLAVLTMFKRYI